MPQYDLRSLGLFCGEKIPQKRPTALWRIWQALVPYSSGFHCMKEDVDRFFSFFEEKIDHISHIDGNSRKIFRKVLYASLIDALSKSVHPKLSNGERFIKIIERFGHWPEGNRYSLPHLKRMLTLVPDPSFEKLRKYVFNRVNEWSIHTGSLIGISNDAEEREIRSLWPNNKDDKKCLDSLTIDSFRHVNLLWAYRNYLVHELREPGYAVECEGDSEPYYITRYVPTDDDEHPQITLELCYPLQFFEDISLNIKSSLKKYFIENELSPHNSYKYGTYWMDELNVMF